MNKRSPIVQGRFARAAPCAAGLLQVRRTIFLGLQRECRWDSASGDSRDVVVFLTAWTQVHIRRAALKAGCERCRGFCSGLVNVWAVQRDTFSWSEVQSHETPAPRASPVMSPWPCSRCGQLNRSFSTQKKKEGLCPQAEQSPESRFFKDN